MKEKTNLLLIMCDQLRADALGCYGNTVVKTPNMDRLAQRGICFDRAYSQTPVCMPARHALISGKNAFELGLIENTLDIPRVSNPLAEMIRNEGYYTCAIGKMHFEPVRAHHGFDRMYLSEEIASHIENDDYLQFLRDKGYGHVIEPHGKRSENYYVPQISELPEELHSSAWTADKTCETIRKNRNRPFFIFSSFIKPHPPFDPCVSYDSLYAPDEMPLPDRMEQELSPDDHMILVQNGYKVNGAISVTNDDLKKMRAHYYGTITQVDQQIGKILDTLEAYGLLENTLIVFTADHGEMLGDHYAFGKRTYYEPSTRIPFIVSWSGCLPQGERRQQLVILQDIYATLIKCAGGCVPEDVCGLDLMKTLLDGNAFLRDTIVAEYGRNRDLKFMLRWGDFKYIYHTNGGIENLYHLKEDPKEFTNMAGQHPDICQSCQSRLVEYYKRYDFSEALQGDSLKKYPREVPEVGGYYNQYPKWQERIV